MEPNEESNALRDKMKLKLLELKTKSHLKRNKALRLNLPYSQSKIIGLLFSVEDKTKHDQVKEFVKKLEADGKQVKVMSFLPKNKDNYEFLFDFFSDKDFSFWGNLTSEMAMRFADIPFDFLFYLDTTPNPLMLNIIAQSKAKCRVGKFWDKGEGFFEMMIETNGGTKGLIDGIYKYSSKLR